MSDTEGWHTSRGAWKAAVACLALAGCTGYEKAEISLSALAAPGRASADRWGSPGATVLDRSDATARAALGLLRSALGLVAASGSPVPAADAQGRPGLGDARLIVRLKRGDSLGAELWRIDRCCALRELEGGAILAWRGEFSPVLLAIETLLPVHRPGGGAPAHR